MKLLIIGSVWPEPDSSAAGRRMMELIHLFKADGWNIVFASASAKSEDMADLSALDIRTEMIAINDSSIETFLRKLQPDAVIFDRFVTEEQFGWRVAEQCPHAVRILDTEDLHCLRRARGKALHEGREFERRELLTNDTARREVASIYRCDCSLIISEFEMKLLKDLFRVDESLMHYLPFLLDPMDESDLQDLPGFEDRTGFMTIGNFRHKPNMDGVQYLYDSIWPLIRKQLPEAEVRIYGAYPSEQAMNLHQPAKGFLVKGRAESSREVVQKARVCLASLRFGAGLKGKLVEGMQCGTPSVTTNIGAEGIAGSGNWSGAIENGPEAFANAAVELHEDKLRWEKARKRGKAILNERFDKSVYGPAFLNRIKEIRDQLSSHRELNFTGQMLMHHTVAGTKYMAKWIEEKNSK